MFLPAWRSDQGLQVRTKSGPGILCLPQNLIDSAWPKERVVAGRKACKRLHKELFADDGIVLALESGAKVSRENLVRDFRRVLNQTVHLRWRMGTTELSAAISESGLGTAIISLDIDPIRFSHIDPQARENLRPPLAGLKTILDSCERLSGLYISNSTLSLSDHEAVGKCELSHLGLRNIKTEWSGLPREDIQKSKAALVSALVKDLEFLDLSNNDLIKGDLEGLRTLEQATSLTHVNLSSNNLGDDRVTVIAKAARSWKQLAHLDLRSNYITAVGAEALGNALQETTSISRVDLSSNRLGDAGVTEISKAARNCKQLVHLGLRSNKITAVGAGLPLFAADAACCPDVGKQIPTWTAAGAEALFGALQECPALASLDCSDNVIGEEGARKIIAILNAVAFKQVVRVDLPLNGIWMGDVRKLDAALRGQRAAVKWRETHD